ncbi:uncharacterized protein LOC127282440 [Leptopilina boulardi]|uniref:uncharacterized protein LOC127282440 n=1 Tax=Leptopilina boulardi TaxID=63433 RepID=UPI0021F541F8|nr:uncharacterized protein LOC127282440 [Leptopilina boulardi]
MEFLLWGEPINWKSKYKIYIYNLSIAISHKIWHIDWINLSNKTKKDLTIIMIRGTKPIKMTGSFVIEMSLATFVKVGLEIELFSV